MKKTLTNEKSKQKVTQKLLEKSLRAFSFLLLIYQVPGMH